MEKSKPSYEVHRLPGKHEQNSVDKTPSSIKNPPRPPVTPKK
jgi:hypothetical protein